MVQFVIKCGVRIQQALFGLQRELIVVELNKSLVKPVLDLVLDAATVATRYAGLEEVQIYQNDWVSRVNC